MFRHRYTLRHEKISTRQSPLSGAWSEIGEDHATNATRFTIDNGFTPVEGAIIADVDSVKSPVLSVAPSAASDMDVTSAPLISVNNDCGYLGVGRPGSVSFVSHRPGAYGRLLLAVYVRWKTGLLVSSGWFRPVMRGAWRAVLPDRVRDRNRW